MPSSQQPGVRLLPERVSRRLNASVVMEIESFHVITADFTSLLAASPNPTSGELQASQTCWNDSPTILEAGRFAACGLS